jgi:hypothetical protein
MFPSKLQATTLSRALGWFSIALGAAELLTARPLARSTGLRGRQSRVRAYGAREIATGVGLLKARDPEPWMWLRVAGDALDLATLLPGSGARGAVPGRGNAVALAAVVGVTLVDLLCVSSLARSRHPAASAVDYSRRSGWPLPASEMRGTALDDFEAPRDMRIPPALRPWTEGRAPASDGAGHAAGAAGPGRAAVPAQTKAASRRSTSTA